MMRALKERLWEGEHSGHEVSGEVSRAGDRATLGWRKWNACEGAAATPQIEGPVCAKKQEQAELLPQAGAQGWTRASQAAEAKANK